MSCGPDNLEEVGAQSVRPSDGLAEVVCRRPALGRPRGGGLPSTHKV